MQKSDTERGAERYVFNWQLSDFNEVRYVCNLCCLIRVTQLLIILFRKCRILTFQRKPWLNLYNCLLSPIVFWVRISCKQIFPYLHSETIWTESFLPTKRRYNLLKWPIDVHILFNIIANLTNLLTYVRHSVVKDLRQGLVELHRRHVETCPVEEQSVNIYSIVRRFFENGVPQREEIEDQQIDGNGVFSRVILPGARQKRLREVKAGNPERCGRALHVPSL